jgi:hypothetical protein
LVFEIDKVFYQPIEQDYLSKEHKIEDNLSMTKHGGQRTDAFLGPGGFERKTLR